jgi:hypothetical protein
MSVLVGITQKRNSSVEHPPRRKISVTQKRVLLSIHLFFMAIWLGSVVCSLALNVVEFSATNPQVLNTAYGFAEILDSFIVRTGAAGSLITGILLAWLTQWGLLRFYWIIAKEIMTVSIIILDQAIIRWNGSAIALTTAQAASPAYVSVRNLLLAGIIVRLVLLLAIVVISIFKPWGQRKSAVKGKARNLAQEVTIADV